MDLKRCGVASKIASFYFEPATDDGHDLAVKRVEACYPDASLILPLAIHFLTVLLRRIFSVVQAQLVSYFLREEYKLLTTTTTTTT